MAIYTSSETHDYDKRTRAGHIVPPVLKKIGTTALKCTLTGVVVAGILFGTHLFIKDDCNCKCCQPKPPAQTEMVTPDDTTSVPDTKPTTPPPTTQKPDNKPTTQKPKEEPKEEPTKEPEKNIDVVKPDTPAIDEPSIGVVDKEDPITETPDDTTPETKEPETEPQPIDPLLGVDANKHGAPSIGEVKDDGNSDFVFGN